MKTQEKLENFNAQLCCSYATSVKGWSKTTFKTPRASYRLVAMAINRSQQFTDCEIAELRKQVAKNRTTHILSFKDAYGCGQTIAIFETDLIKFDNYIQRCCYHLRMFNATALGYIGINTVKIIVNC